MPKPKSERPMVFNPELRVGEGDAAEAVVECRTCNNVNFLVRIEPEYRDVGEASARDIAEKTARRVQFCPFCGGEELGEV